MSAESQVHQIGTVAERVGLSLRTIRHYEAVGLVIPSGRSTGGFRLYTDSDIERLAQVKMMKPLGFSLEETVELLALRDSVRAGSTTPAQSERLQQFADRATEACTKLRRQLELASEFVDSLRAESPTSHPRVRVP